MGPICLTYVGENTDCRKWSSPKLDSVHNHNDHIFMLFQLVIHVTAYLYDDYPTVKCVKSIGNHLFPNNHTMEVLIVVADHIWCALCNSQLLLHSRADYKS